MPALHRSQVLGSPWEGVYCTHIDSARHYGRHWHATYGLGLIDDGAQSSTSGRGNVDAYAGDLVTTNPGEVHDGPSLGDMAAMAGLSKYQLLRRFEKAYGMTPHAWLLQQRAERARGLIAGGTGLAAAAAASGFADQSHMTRIFMRQFGFTPGAWKRAAGSPQ